MWRPKDGFERRFEIQRKEDYEREEMEREKEREREGENYQGTSLIQQTWGDCVQMKTSFYTDSLHIWGNRCALAAEQDVIRRRTRGE